MTGLSLTLLILASLTAINADSCNKPDFSIKDSCQGRYCILENQPRSLPEGNEIQAGFEMVRDFFRTSELPTVGYLDPLYIENHRIEIDDDEVSAAVDIAATTIKGLLGFEVTDIKISLNGEKYQLDFLFPEIFVSGKYNILPAPKPQEDDLYGNGEFVTTAINLRVEINVDAGKTSDGDLFVEKMKSQLTLEAADVKVTGLFDDELESEAASWRISQYLPESMPYFEEAVDEFLETYTEYVNTKLKFLKFLKRNV